MISIPSKESLGRRDFLKAAAGLAPALLLPMPLQALALDTHFWERPRELWIRRQDNGETARVVYYQNGRYDVDAYCELCRIMRDRHAHREVRMDPVLFDLLRGVAGYFENVGYREPIILTSGYRTFETNRKLRERGVSAARVSMHCYGKAADIHMAGVAPATIARLGLYFKHGGVGFYPNNGFVHLDTGNVRFWRG